MLSSLPVLLPDYPLAWISIDEEDNDPVRFIGLFVAALGKLHPQCGKSALSHIVGGINNDSDLRKVATALINDIVAYISEPFIVVLDDLHFVTESMVYQVLDHLLEQRPPNLHLAIGTRTDPALRLSRLAARGQLGEFRRGDLSLNLDQTVILADLYRRNLAIAAISLDSEGEPVYRYHALLGRMLRERLSWECPSEVVELHRRAAEIQKTPGRAIAHYLQAGLWEQAVQLIISFGMQMLYQGMAETIQ